MRLRRGIACRDSRRSCKCRRHTGAAGTRKRVRNRRNSEDRSRGRHRRQRTQPAWPSMRTGRQRTAWRPCMPPHTSHSARRRSSDRRTGLRNRSSVGRIDTPRRRRRRLLGKRGRTRHSSRRRSPFLRRPPRSASRRQRKPPRLRCPTRRHPMRRHSTRRHPMRRRLTPPLRCSTSRHLTHRHSKRRCSYRSASRCRRGRTPAPGRERGRRRAQRRPFPTVFRTWRASLGIGRHDRQGRDGGGAIQRVELLDEVAMQPGSRGEVDVAD